MGLELSDSRRAGLAALILPSGAAFIVFVFRPGGFEGQGAWLVILLPGAIPGMLLSDLASKVAPFAEGIVYWSSVFGLSFFWYFVLSLAVIKIHRFLT